MSEGFIFTITTAGLDALVDAQNGVTEQIEIVELGLSDQLVDVAPTLVALPGEFKRLDVLSGQSASETIIHMNAFDSSDDGYEVRSLALYLADGTLFAAFSRADGAIFRKVDIATFLFTIDVAFADAVANSIVFGDATFLYPPATETTKGVAEIATQGEVDGGADDERIVTPAKLAGRLAPVLQSIADEVDMRGDGDDALQALIDALLARTFTGDGLVSGGGSLSASRVLTVVAALSGDAWAGTASDKALTPASLGPVRSALSINGYASIFSASDTRQLMLQWGRFTPSPSGLTNVTFPLAFTTTFAVLVDGGAGIAVGSEQYFPRAQTTSLSPGSFQVRNNSDSTPGMYLAIGEILR